MTKRFAVCVVFLATLLVGTCAFAQKSEGGHKGGKIAASSSKADAKVDSLSQQLTLTDEQKASIKPILQDESKKLHDLKKDASVASDDKKAKSKEIRKNTLQQIRAVLTPDQQKKLDAMPESHATGGKKAKS